MLTQISTLHPYQNKGYNSLKKSWIFIHSRKDTGIDI